MNSIKIFISYSWGDDNLKKWVGDFAELLREEGFDVLTDQDTNELSQDINNFMEKGISEADTILIVCTPDYKEKSDNRIQYPEKGVAFEARIISGLSKSKKSIIPIVFNNNSGNIPTYATGYPFVSFVETQTIVGTDENFITLRNMIINASPEKFQKYIRIKKNFYDWMNDIGLLDIYHKNLCLEDIFIYPRLSSMDGNIKNAPHKRLSGSQLLEEQGVYVISGENQFGKSTYSRKLFLDFFNEGFYPILIFNNKNDKDFPKFGKDPRSLLNKQYDGILNINDDIKKKTILIIDDFHKMHKTKQDLLSRLFKDYYSVVIFTDNVFELDLRNRDTISSMKRFQIKEFTASMRTELVEKWISANQQGHQSEMDFITLVEEKTSLIEKTLGKSYARGIMPSTPFFIISIISSVESFDISQQREITSQGHCYQALIFLCLKAIGIQTSEIDTYINFLTELSNYYYENRVNEISQEQMNGFISSYKEEYNLNIAEASLLANLLSVKLLRKDSLGMYTFYYPYIFYYFVGKYLSENLKISKERIADIINNLHLEKNSYICIFLIHHNKDTDIMDEIALNAMMLFDKKEPATLKLDQLSFFNTMKNPMFLDVLPRIEKDYTEYRSDKLAEKDTVEECMEENDESLYMNDTDDDCSGNIRELKKSIHTAEVIGTIVKNRVGSLKKEIIESLIEEGIKIHLRFMSQLLSSMEDEELKEMFYSLVIQSILDNNSEDNGNLMQDTELKNFAEGILIRLGYQILLCIFDIISNLIGSKEILANIDRICNKNRTPAFIILKHLFRMRYSKTIDVKEICSDYKNCGFSYITENLLKYFVVDHCSTHPINYRDKQKISKMLDIPQNVLIPQIQENL